MPFTQSYAFMLSIGNAVTPPSIIHELIIAGT